MAKPRSGAADARRNVRGRAEAPALSTRALNRALLDRQWLLEPMVGEADWVPAQLVGLQSQAPNPPYVGAWTRLETFRPAALSAAIASRQLVRIAMMRSTIHLVTAEDALRFRPVLAAALDRMMRAAYGKRLAGIDEPALADAAREAVEAQPLTLGDLGAALARRWPDRDPAALANAARAWVPLVQATPRGLWGESGPAAHTTLEAWLGRSAEVSATPRELVTRYLRAFGPASVRDAQVWSGLVGLKDVFESLRPELVAFRDAAGAELFDLPDAPRPDAETPAAPRYLPEWDNVLLSHADRSRIIPGAHKARLMTSNGIVPGTLLLDGFVAGQWKVVRDGRAAMLSVDLFDGISPHDRRAAEDEGARLLALLAPDADSPDVRITPGG